MTSQVHGSAVLPTELWNMILGFVHHQYLPEKEVVGGTGARVLANSDSKEMTILNGYCKRSNKV